jgi:hypothetical protein
MGMTWSDWERTDAVLAIGRKARRVEQLAGTLDAAVAARDGSAAREALARLRSELAALAVELGAVDPAIAMSAREVDPSWAIDAGSPERSAAARELAARERALAERVAVAVQEIAALEREASTRPRETGPGLPPDVPAALNWVRAQLAELHASWLTSRRADREAAVARADRALRALGGRREVRQLLSAGSRWTTPLARAACDRIAVVLEVPLTAPP